MRKATTEVTQNCLAHEPVCLKRRSVGAGSDLPKVGGQRSAAVEAVLREWLIPMLVRRFLDSRPPSDMAVPETAPAQKQGTTPGSGDALLPFRRTKRGARLSSRLQRTQ
jgi:hypothetical protein